MKLSDTVSSSFQNIIAHPLRSLLTIIAIIIGIFAVVLMFSSITGIQRIIRDNMEQVGFNNALYIYPGQANISYFRSSSAVRQIRPAPLKAKPLDFDDYLALKQNVEHRHLYGIVSRWFDNSSFAQGERVQLIATGSDFFPAKNYAISKGRAFSNYEMNNGARVCLLGSGLVEKYFEANSLIGERITIGGLSYIVIGVVADSIGSSSFLFHFGDWERRRELSSVFIPLTTGISYLKPDKSVDYLFIQSHTTEEFASMTNRTRQVLLANHNMSHDFSFRDIGSFMAEITKETEEFMKKWNITLTAIASISLLVGGLGLFSTMLISISERLLEIGIRKSVGASPNSIFFHYLIESLILSLIAAIIGILLSIGTIKIFSLIIGMAFPVVIEGVMLGTFFSIIIGLLSGVYPALKAAEINPIQAIYYNE